MIYQFKDGPLDGAEKEIAEIPLGQIFAYPIRIAPNFIASEEIENFRPVPKVCYRVTDIGEMTLDHYEG